LLFLLVFTSVGGIAYLFLDIRYFFLFWGIGMSEFGTRTFIIHFPKWRQFFRRLVQVILGSFFVFYLGFVAGVNFQFEEIFFDAHELIVTGALIQFIVARLVLPWFFGNAFCSRACWSGVFFEATNSKSCKQPMKRNEWLAWGYLSFLIVSAVAIVYFWRNPATDETLRKWFILGENIFILGVGFLLTFKFGSRAYCRLLCPFLTVSSRIAPYSLFKITPIDAETCIACNKCNNACPMLIDVKGYVGDRAKVTDGLCILCERCVTSCPKDLLKISNHNAK